MDPEALSRVAAVDAMAPYTRDAMVAALIAERIVLRINAQITEANRDGRHDAARALRVVRQMVTELAGGAVGAPSEPDTQLPFALEQQIGAARKFSRGRVTAGHGNLGPERGLIPRWYPRVAGEWVRNADDPQDGYSTKPEALDAARKYQASCDAFLREHAPSFVLPIEALHPVLAKFVPARPAGRE